jgi:hypothetical protein
VASGTSNAGVATLLSVFFLFGGQLYNHDFKKAVLIFVLGGVCIPLIAAGGFGALLWFVLWIWAVSDAHTVASGRRRPW